MATLTRKQKDAVSSLMQSLARERALHMPSFPVPAPLPSSWGSDKTQHGWRYNERTGEVMEVWNKGPYHYREDPDVAENRGGRICGSQMHARCWATKEEAAMAMIHEMARNFADDLIRAYKLAGIDLRADVGELICISEQLRLRHEQRESPQGVPNEDDDTGRISDSA